MPKKTQAEERLEALGRRVDLVEAILDLDTGECRGSPAECQDRCTDETCPLRNNRVHQMGSLLVTVLEEFRWHRAWADELEAIGLVPPGTQDRVAKRVRKSQLEEALMNAEDSLSRVSAADFPALYQQIEARIGEIKVEIQSIANLLATPSTPVE